MMPKKDIQDITLKHAKDIEVRNIKSAILISAIEERFDISKEDKSPMSHLTNPFPIDPHELEQGSTRDAENQTFLQGVPIVTIPIEYQDEALQTMSMSSPCPPTKYFQSPKFHRMPTFESDSLTQTTITIDPRTSHHEAVKYLSSRRHEKHQENPLQEKLVDKETIIRKILNCLLCRAMWISDPDIDQIETKSQETQTVIQYHCSTDCVILDNETQTTLSCKPICSNSKLLNEYKETKNFMQSCLSECLRRIESRIIIDDLIDEIIKKGASRLKYPMKEQVVQTVASYKSHELREEDVLRKLRITLVIDPFEASAVVMSLIDNLLHLTCAEIFRDAQHVVKSILDSSIQRASWIGFRSAEIRKEAQLISIEEMFDRRRKIIELMLKKKTEIAAIQTKFAGVPEVAKIQEPKIEIECPARAGCSMYSSAPAQEDLSPKSTKLLRAWNTMDMLAYSPHYDATTSEEPRISHLQRQAVTENRIEKVTITRLLASRNVTAKKTDDTTTATTNIPTTPEKNIKAEDSIIGWTHTFDGTLESWSLKDSSSEATNISTESYMTVSQSCCEKSSQSESVSSVQGTKAMQVLKNTFCTPNTCQALVLSKSLKKRWLPGNGMNNKYMYLEDCTLGNLCQYCMQSINIECQTCARLRVDKFRDGST